MNERKRSNKAVFYILFASALLGFVVVWRLFFVNVSFYVPAAVMLVFSMLPLFYNYEKAKSSTREITLVASMVALAVVSRAVFYLIPQVKPIAAVVVISAVCLGAERGFAVGALSAFVSNFIFGQGTWTPFQMAALGLVGLISGLLFKRIKPNRIALAIVGFVLSFALYGAVVDISTILVMYGRHITLSGVLSVYAAGVPFSLTFGISTAVFLFIFGEALINKLNRVITKYNILKND